ncbi:MAG: hypothetical protein R2942_13965 [Ignavibacteria bacterium]
MWDTLSSNTDLRLYSLNFFNENSGWMLAEIPGLLMKTTNGGNSFIKINSGSVRYISDIDFIDNNTGWYSSGEKENFSRQPMEEKLVCSAYRFIQCWCWCSPVYQTPA